MALNITKQADVLTVENLVVTIYGPPGLGKSTTGFSASRPLLLDFDLGAHRAKGRKDSVQIQSWSDVRAMEASDLEPYNTIIVDTAGRCLDVLANEIMRQDPKMGRGGALSLQGYGRLKADFTAWMKLLRMAGKDVVLLAHAEEKQEGDSVAHRIDMMGASKNEVYKVSDAMGWMSVVAGKRTINFSPTDATYGKDPAQLGLVTVPDIDAEPDFLGSLIQSVKDSMNSLSAEQQELSMMMADWSQDVSRAVDATSLNTLIDASQDADERVRDNVKRMIVKQAKSVGVRFDAEAKRFVEEVAA